MTRRFFALAATLAPLGVSEMAFAQHRSQGGDAAGCAACGGGLLFMVGVPLLAVVLNIALLVWVARDAKARGMDSSVIWMLLVLFTGCLGLLIYAFSRPQGNLVQCHRCNNRRLQASVKCPHCGTGEGEGAGLQRHEHAAIAVPLDTGSFDERHRIEARGPARTQPLDAGPSPAADPPASGTAPSATAIEAAPARASIDARAASAGEDPEPVRPNEADGQPELLLSRSSSPTAPGTPWGRPSRQQWGLLAGAGAALTALVLGAIAIAIYALPSTNDEGSAAVDATSNISGTGDAVVSMPIMLARPFSLSYVQEGSQRYEAWLAVDVDYTNSYDLSGTILLTENGTAFGQYTLAEHGEGSAVAERSGSSTRVSWVTTNLDGNGRAEGRVSLFPIPARTRGARVTISGTIHANPGTSGTVRFFVTRLGGEAPPDRAGVVARGTGEPVPTRLASLTPTSFAASSELTSGRHVYRAANAFDGDRDSAWSEGVEGTGVGQWVEARFDRPQLVRRVRLTTGYDKVHRRSGDLFSLNAHLRRVRLRFEDGTERSMNVGERQREATFDGLDVRTRTVRIIADAVWPGTRWQDLSISEVWIEGSTESGSGRVAQGRSPRSSFAWEHDGARCVATLEYPTIEVECTPDDDLERIFGCAGPVRLGVDLLGDTQHLEELVDCSDANMSQDVLFVVDRGGAILAAFDLPVTAFVERASFQSDRLVLDLVYPDTSGEGDDARERVVLPWDRQARRLGGAPNVTPIRPTR